MQIRDRGERGCQLQFLSLLEKMKAVFTVLNTDMSQKKKQRSEMQRCKVAVYSDDPQQQVRVCLGAYRGVGGRWIK